MIKSEGVLAQFIHGSNWGNREKSSQLLILWLILTDSGQKIVQTAEMFL